MWNVMISQILVLILFPCASSSYLSFSDSSLFTDTYLLYCVLVYSIVSPFFIIMLSVNFFCNISSYDILAYITKNYIALIYYAKIVYLLCQFHAGEVGFSAVCQAIYSQSTYKGADPICQSIIVATNIIIHVTVF